MDFEFRASSSGNVGLGVQGAARGFKAWHSTAYLEYPMELKKKGFRTKDGLRLLMVHGVEGFELDCCSQLSYGCGVYSQGRSGVGCSGLGFRAQGLGVVPSGFGSGIVWFR